MIFTWLALVIGVGTGFSALLLANLLVALAIGAAAAVLGLLHAIVLHFARLPLDTVVASG